MNEFRKEIKCFKDEVIEGLKSFMDVYPCVIVGQVPTCQRRAAGQLTHGMGAREKSQDFS